MVLSSKPSLSMKPILSVFAASVFSLTASLSNLHAAAAKPTVKQLVEAVEKEAAEHPSEAAAIVSKNVKAHPEYACLIIKAVIKAASTSKADEPALIGAALAAAPEKAAEIKACLPVDQTAGPSVSDDFLLDSNSPGVSPDMLASPGGGNGSPVNPSSAPNSSGSTSARSTSTPAARRVVNVVAQPAAATSGTPSVPATESAPALGVTLETMTSVTKTSAGSLTLNNGQVYNNGAYNLSPGLLTLNGYSTNNQAISGTVTINNGVATLHVPASSVLLLNGSSFSASFPGVRVVPH